MATLGRILSIDDEDALRESIVAYLEDSGFEVLEARNGEEGLACFRREKPDLVLSDLQMPHMSGLEVLRSINRESPETPVIVVSGAGSMNDAIEALRLGAWDYLIKPIQDMAVLEHAVVKSIERARLTAENQAYRVELERRNVALQKSLSELKADQQAGRAVQTRLLPPTELTVRSYRLSYKITPSLYLSGDFTDYFQLDAQTLGFYVADVSGHGAASAFVTVFLKNLMQRLMDQFHTHMNDTIKHPHAVLEWLNQEIYGAQLGKYATMVYGTLCTTTHTLTYATAGHFPAPILVDQKAAYLPGRGFGVGMTPRASYENHTVAFPNHGKLVLFSDGVMEVMLAPNLSAKEQRLLEWCEDPHLSVDQLRQRLNLSDEPGNFPDDIAMVIIERCT